MKKIRQIERCAIYVDSNTWTKKCQVDKTLVQFKFPTTWRLLCTWWAIDIDNLLGCFSIILGPLGRAVYKKVKKIYLKQCLIQRPGCIPTLISYEQIFYRYKWILIIKLCYQRVPPVFQLRMLVLCLKCGKKIMIINWMLNNLAGYHFSQCRWRDSYSTFAIKRVGQTAVLPDSICWFYSY